MTVYDCSQEEQVTVGSKIPAARINLYGEVVNLREFFQHRTGVLFGLTGAYAPNCTTRHAPAIRDAADEIRRHVDFVGCILVNDPFVVKAWAKKLGLGDQFTFIADSFGEFTKALGLGQSLKEYGFGYRSRRFAMVVGPMARIQWLGFKDDATPARVLEVLPKLIRAPWKLLTIGIEHYEHFPDIPAIGKTVSDMTTFITSEQNGFSEELDWQLCLSDSHEDSFQPTRENTLNGLQWLVEGAQPGDSLFLYLAGHTMKVEGTEIPYFMPSDTEHAKSGLSAHGFYEIFNKLVPGCRITIVFDSHTCGPSFCLPFVATNQGSFESFHALEECGSDLGENSEIIMFALKPKESNSTAPGLLGRTMINTLMEFPIISYKQLLKKLQMDIGSEADVCLYSTQKFSLEKEFTVSEPIG